MSREESLLKELAKTIKSVPREERREIDVSPEMAKLLREEDGWTILTNTDDFLDLESRTRVQLHSDGDRNYYVVVREVQAI